MYVQKVGPMSFGDIGKTWTFVGRWNIPWHYTLESYQDLQTRRSTEAGS